MKGKYIKNIILYFSLIFILLAFTGTILFGQEASSADGDISLNTINATSGATYFTYTITNTDPDIGDYIDEARITNPFSNKDDIIVTGAEVNGTSWSVLNSKTKPTIGGVLHWYYNSSETDEIGPPFVPANTLLIQMVANALNGGQTPDDYVAITFIHYGLSTVSAGVDYSATADQESEGTPETITVVDNDFTLIIDPAEANKVVITDSGDDFIAGGSTTLTVQVQDQYGNLRSSDNTTQVTFDPTLSGTISDVNVGTGDGGYDVPGGAETVTVAGGVATITLTDKVAETFEVVITNNQSLINPPNDSITVSSTGKYNG